MNNITWNMYNAIISTDVKKNVYIGKPSIKDEFEEKQYIPTTISDLVKEKVTNDLNTLNYPSLKG